MTENVNFITVALPEESAVLRFNGRDAWTLATLIDRGETGVTPIERPAPRWSEYVRRLRKAGLVILTIDEQHSGPYKGHHGRYVLKTAVLVIERKVAA